MLHAIKKTITVAIVLFALLITAAFAIGYLTAPDTVSSAPTHKI